MVGYREQDDRKALEEQGESGDVQGITHTIYKFEDNKFKQIYTKRTVISRALLLVRIAYLSNGGRAILASI